MYKVFKCEQCQRYFKEREIAISCTVMHPSGQCCHYGYEPYLTEQEFKKSQFDGITPLNSNH